MIKVIISNAKNKMQDAYSYATFAKDFKSQNIAKVFEEYENALNYIRNSSNYDKALSDLLSNNINDKGLF